MENAGSDKDIELVRKCLTLISRIAARGACSPDIEHVRYTLMELGYALFKSESTNSPTALLEGSISMSRRIRDLEETHRELDFIDSTSQDFTAHDALKYATRGTWNQGRYSANRIQPRRSPDAAAANREIAWIESLTLSGYPDLEGLCLALPDWSARRTEIRDARNVELRSVFCKPDTTKAIARCGCGQPRDRVDRVADSLRLSGSRRTLPCASRLVGETADGPTFCLIKRQTPPNPSPAARERLRCGSGFDGVAALAVLALNGSDRQAHFLADRAREEAANRMRLPAGGFISSLHVAPPGRLSRSRTLAVLLPSRAGSALPLALARLGRLLGGGGLLARLGLLRRHVRATFAQPWAFSWLSARQSR